jgi:hypothetical protein
MKVYVCHSKYRVSEHRVFLFEYDAKKYCAESVETMVYDELEVEE